MFGDPACVRCGDALPLYHAPTRTLSGEPLCDLCSEDDVTARQNVKRSACEIVTGIFGRKEETNA